MRFFAQIVLYIILGFSVAVIQKNGDEGRPYEFGFTIDGQQHRHEKKDENGIIQGEFGFITADGVYHVTVYATDENGNFKILSMRNIRISAPLDGSPALGPISPEAGKYLGKISQGTPSTVQQPIQKFERLQQQPVVPQQLVTTAPSKTFDFTTQRTIKPACGGCGYVTTNKPFQFQNLAFQKPAGQLTGPSSGQSSFVSQQTQGNIYTQNDLDHQHYQLSPTVSTIPQNQGIVNISGGFGLQGPNTVQNGLFGKSQGTTHTQNGLDNQHYQAQISTVGDGFVNYRNSFENQPKPPSAVSAISQSQGITHTQNRYDNQQHQPDVPQVGGSFANYPSQNQLLGANGVDSKPQLPSTASILYQNQGLITPSNGFGQPQASPQGPATIQSDFKGQQNQPQTPPTGSNFESHPQNQLRIDDSFSSKPQLPLVVSTLPQRQGLVAPNDFGTSQGQGLTQGLGGISQAQIRPDIGLLPPGSLQAIGGIQKYPIQNKQQQQYQNYQNQQKEISGNRNPAQTNLIQPPSPFSQHRADDVDYNQGPKELSSPPFVSSPKLPPQIEQISTLPPVSVSDRVIHVGGSHPQNIPITDKFPGMEDGLPDGIEEKDVKNILYKFKYIVGFHGHYEKGLKNGAKIGGYFVNGRDGISRVVTYVADENGYRPKFKFINLGLDSSDTPKEETEKTFGLKSFEFVWYPLE